MSVKNLLILSVVLVFLTVFSSAKPKPQCSPCVPYPGAVPPYPQYPVRYGPNFYPDNGQQVGVFASPAQQQHQIRYQLQSQLPAEQMVIQQQPQMQVQPVQQFARYEVPQQYNQMGLGIAAPCNQHNK